MADSGAKGKVEPPNIKSDVDEGATECEKKPDPDKPSLEVHGNRNMTVSVHAESVINIHNSNPPAKESSIGDADADRPTANSSQTLPQEKLRLVLVGHTGGGKSETGNSILCDRRRFDSSPSFGSITKECNKSTGADIRASENNSKDIVVVDTPGLFDTHEDPDAIAKKITECIIKVSPGSHAILSVTPIARMTREVQQSADGIRRLFGDRSLQYMIVIFTCLDNIKRCENISGIDEVIGTAPPALGRILQECGNRYVAFDNTLAGDSEENKKQVSDLLDMVDEMVGDNGEECYTNDLLEEANRLLEIEKKRCERELQDKFKEREARIRAEYEEHIAAVEKRQKELQELQEMTRKLKLEQKEKEFQENIEKLQNQIDKKEKEFADMDAAKKQKLEELKSELTEAKQKNNQLKTEKSKLEKRKQTLTVELLTAISKKEMTEKYLEELLQELEREQARIQPDPNNPPPNVVQYVKSRMAKCPIL